jgi:hypothetical protein
VDLASVAAIAPATTTTTTRSSCRRTFIFAADAPSGGAVTRAAATRVIAVTTITITYDRSDALCSGGAMTRLIAFSAASVPVYSRSVLIRGCQRRFRRLSRAAYAAATPNKVTTLSISAVESPCQRASDMSNGVFRIEPAAADSGAFRIEGATPAKAPQNASASGGSQRNQLGS